MYLLHNRNATHHTFSFLYAYINAILHTFIILTYSVTHAAGHTCWIYRWYSSRHAVHRIIPGLRLQRKAKEALLNVSVCSQSLQSRNVLTFPTSQPELSQLSRHTYKHTVMLAHTHTVHKQTTKLTQATFTFFVTSSGGVFPAVIVSRVYCIVSSPSCTDQDSSLSLSQSSEVLPSTHFFCPAAENHNIRSFCQGPTTQRWAPPCGLSCPGVRAGAWFNSRPLQQTERWRLMPWVFHKGWGRLEEGGGRGREGRRRGMRVWEFEIASFFFSSSSSTFFFLSFFFFWVAQPTSDVTLMGKKDRRRE